MTGAHLAALTRNQRLVFEALAADRSPKSAYALLDALRGEGLRAPQQIYRALAQLMEGGLVHRIEGINAYVACVHPDAHDLDASVFLVCRSCEGAEEVDDRAVMRALHALCGDAGFAAEKRTVELYGLCRGCREGGAA